LNQTNGDDYRELTLEDILRIFRKRLLLFFLVVVGVVVATGIYLFLATPIYEASVTIKVDPATRSSIDIFTAGLTGTTSSRDIATEIELIKSRSNFETVIERLELVERIYTSFEIQEMLSEGYTQNDIEASLAKTLSNITSVSPVKDTRIVRVSVQHRDRTIARDVANTLAEVYNEKLAELSRRDATTRREFIESQIPSVEEQVRRSSDALREFKEKTGIYVLDAQARWLLDMLSNYDKQFNALVIELEEKKAEVVAYQKLLDEFDSPEAGALQEKWINTSHTLSLNPVITQLRNKLALLKVDLAALEDQYPATDQRIRAKKAEIAATEKLIQEEIENEFIRTGEGMSLNPTYQTILTAVITSETSLQIIESTIQSVDMLRKTYLDALAEIPRLEQQLLELQREVYISENLYTLLLERLEEAKISEAAVIGNAAVIDSALIPSAPVKPNRRLSLAIGGVLGIFLGMLGVFLAEYLDKTLKSEEDIERVASEPILGRIPLANGIRNELFVQSDPTSPPSEAVKIASSNISFTLGDGKVIGVTSPLPGEGKTTVAANIAYSYAMSGQRVLLVDLDMRKPRIEQLLGMDDRSSEGIVDIVLDNRNVGDLIIKYAENLDVLPVGKIPPNPTVLLSSKKIAALIEGLKNEYDRIIVDLPPAVITSDVALVGHLFDGVLMVTQPGTTLRDALRMAISNLKTSGAKVLGFVVNGVTVKTSGYYYHYYYYHYSEGTKKRKEHRKVR